MSVNNESENNYQHPLWDILTDHQDIKINKKFYLKFLKESKNVLKEVKDSCKVLNFSSEWNFEEVLVAIDELDPTKYPQLFIFIIETTNFGFTEEHLEDSFKKMTTLQKKLLKFGNTRPMILQLTSADENVTKIYYKEETLNQFIVIDQQQDECKVLVEFTSILRLFLDGGFPNSEIEVLNMVQEIKYNSLILRFLRALTLSEAFFGSLILDVALKYTKAEFLAVLDSPFENNGRILSIRAQKGISDVFGDDDDPENDDSVLLRAIKNENKEVIDYLITYWTHLLQQLPFEHQVIISTVAFETNKLDVLCDLLDIGDFPFPKNFNINLINHIQLRKISRERVEFKAAIQAENFNKIDKFVIENPRHKFIYSYDNNSALTEAINLKKFAVFYYLKSLGCRGENCQDVLQKLSQEEKEQAVKHATNQRKINVVNAKININNSILLLSTRSLIHNSKISKEQDAEYRQRIMKWLEDIRKVAPELIDAAASCEHLKIIFDFESDSVENMSLTGAYAAGSMYPISKWVFVGSKLSDRNGNLTKQREQIIKGVLAHELCHYVMRLVYENQENPYYKHSAELRDVFITIVEAIDKWSSKDSTCPNDECNGIISSVFQLYTSKDFHPELIVRIVQILAEFDDNDEHLRYLQHKYRSLFVFWEIIVIPEMLKFINENREAVRKINKTFGLLKAFENDKIQLSFSKDLKILDNHKSVIIRTNIPNLLILNICNHLQLKFGNQLDTQNIFVNPEKLKNKNCFDDLNSLITKNPKINVFVNCSKDVDIDWKLIKFSKESNLVFIVSNEILPKKIKKIILDRKDNGALTEIHYKWSHLKVESQKFVLRTKINFQNNSDLILLDLFKKDTTTINTNCKHQDRALLKICSKVIDDQLLNMLLDGSEIITIKPLQESENEKQIEFLFQQRQFIRKHNLKKTSNKDKSILKNKISYIELLSEVRKQQYVLISDQAGKGKSWAMKNFSKILREQIPTNWVTYVDLKQFIDEFKVQKDEYDFSTFMVENILKLQQKFEAKIFQKLYKDGKVFILFDGFDEIAPNYAELVTKLIQSFQSNDGNQLWIGTRDYFEVDLKEELKLSSAYKLDEMTEMEGFDLIARSWILKDLEKDKREPKSKEIFDKSVKLSPNYENYQQKARQIVEKALISRKTSVGLPQLFKMIADEFKDEKNIDNLHGSKIYGKFIDIIYTRWSRKKGQVREEANVKSQRFELSFYKFYQYQAILSLFPKLAEILFPGYDSSEWPEMEVIACGILSKKDGKYFFLHETFREYFVADTIAYVLKKPEIEEKVIEIFVEILTVEKFEIIRMFLNDNIDDNISLQKYQPQIQKVYEMENFHKLLIDNFKLGLMIIKNESYEVVKNLFWNNKNWKMDEIFDTQKFLKFQDFFINFLKVDDLKELIVKKEIFKEIIISSLDIEVFEDFVLLVEAKIDREFVKLMLEDRDYWPKRNIFYFLCRSSNLNDQKVIKFLEIMEIFFTVTEIFQLMSKCNEIENNVLHVCVDTKNKESLKTLWTYLEKYFKVKRFSQSFNEFIKQRDSYKRNIIFYAARCEQIEVRETLWQLLLKTFENRDELMNFMLNKDSFSINFVHELVRLNKNLPIIESTCKILKENFTEAQFLEIFTSKDKNDRNLFHTAARKSKHVEVHQFFLNFFRDLYETNEKFLEKLNEVDEYGQNILHLAAENSSIEVFEFLIQQLEIITSQDKIREMLSHSTIWNQNLLQSAAEWNKSLDFHKFLWKSLRKYFENSEILQFVKHVDIDGNNLLYYAASYNTKEIVQLTWKEIKSFFNLNEQVEYLKMKGENGKNLLEYSLENSTQKVEVRYWVKNLLQMVEHLSYKMDDSTMNKNQCFIS